MLRFAKRSVSVTKTAAATEIADFRYMFLARLSVRPHAGFLFQNRKAATRRKTKPTTRGVELSHPI